MRRGEKISSGCSSGLFRGETSGAEASGCRESAEGRQISIDLQAKEEIIALIMVYTREVKANLAVEPDDYSKQQEVEAAKIGAAA